ncbi:class I SAM-dependent methyltransferase [Candidatus Poriferisocius sp.]|uniref:class I SAM-dependent methyltransferase n=1 Tax=Candidatus Poriferisocius sp. TaxID=3101276 RepID=UPI003B0166D5
MTGEPSSEAPDHGLWEQHAGWWQSQCTDGADPEYAELIVPLAAELLAGYDRVLDIGAGEGQLSRLAAGLGASLAVGVDPTRAQIVEAACRGGGAVYARGQAEALPLADQSFDAAVACLVFEHIDAMDAAVAEAARMLRDGGRFLLFLNHPLLQTPDSGWIDDHILDPPEQYWRIGPYLRESVMIEEVQKDVFLPFVHRPLSRYVNALRDAGLAIDRMLEPAPPPGFLAAAPEYVQAETIPRLLVLVCRKEPQSS